MSLHNFNRSIYPNKDTIAIQELYMNDFKDWFKYNYNFIQLCIALSINMCYPKVIIENKTNQRSGKEIKFDTLFGNENDRLTILMFLSYEYSKHYNKAPDDLDLAFLLQEHWNNGAKKLNEIYSKFATPQREPRFTSSATSSLLSEIFSLLPNESLITEDSPDKNETFKVNNSFITMLENALNQNKIFGSILAIIEGPRLEIIEYQLSASQNISEQMWKQVKLALGNENITWKSANDGRSNMILIEKEKDNFKPVLFKDLIRLNQRNFNLPIYVGLDQSGESFTFNLEECPHLLVAGTTGSGKSETMKAIISSLIGNNNVDQIVILDPKRVDYVKFESYEQVSLITNKTEMVDCLSELYQEMESRYQILEESKCNGILEYNQNNTVKMKYKIVFVDELADLVLTTKIRRTKNSPENETSSEELLILLAQKSRAAGIHLVLSTQRPDAETLNGLLRSNISSRIACRVLKRTESNIILDESGAEDLFGKGDMYIKLSGKDKVRVQGALV